MAWLARRRIGPLRTTTSHRRARARLLRLNLVREVETRVVASSTADDDDGGATSGPRVRAMLRIPIPHDDVGGQNGYRVVPWSSIGGESVAQPWSE